MFAAIHPRFKTPHLAILAGGVIGVAAIYSDEWVQVGGQSLTANLVTLSVFGAIVLYVMSMLSLFRLRRTEPDRARPFHAVCYPWFPAFALVVALICLSSVIWYNLLLAGIFLGFMGLGWLYFRLCSRQRLQQDADVMSEIARGEA
jgi:ethanolamine permease